MPTKPTGAHRRRPLRTKPDPPTSGNYTPRQIFGSGFGHWWQGIRGRTKVALIIAGIIVLVVAASKIQRPEANHEPPPSQSEAGERHLTAKMMSHPDFTEGWNEVFRQYHDNQAWSACRVVQRAIGNQGGVYATWEELKRRNPDGQTTFEHYAGVVMACHHIYGQ